jgi:hypothetical protein
VAVFDVVVERAFGCCYWAGAADWGDGHWVGFGGGWRSWLVVAFDISS